ncbi:S8/S53 family peptidase [Meiothermus sp.]|uniref:S8 family peptidase n=1 Tax=Meiothermus sp. TaxID=1955249 RepID=UPI00307DFFC8
MLEQVFGSANAQTRFADARQAGLGGSFKISNDGGAKLLVLVAAAGNNGQNYGFAPCMLDGVICVGALANDSNTAISNSNYGSFVDIWAPTDIHAVYGDNPPLGLAFFGGTSASTPFIAGVAALMRAYNPSLTSDQVKTILQQTGYNNSPDPKVNYYVNAFAAVLNAAGNYLNPDPLEPNNTPAQASLPSPTIAPLAPISVAASPCCPAQP